MRITISPRSVSATGLILASTVTLPVAVQCPVCSPLSTSARDGLWSTGRTHVPDQTGETHMDRSTERNEAKELGGLPNTSWSYRVKDNMHHSEKCYYSSSLHPALPYTVFGRQQTKPVRLSLIHRRTYARLKLNYRKISKP